jgi:hypothetical protein
MELHGHFARPEAMTWQEKVSEKLKRIGGGMGAGEPVRILALDGGGIRGVFSLQILARIEELFRQKYGKPGLKLADVFDLIAGTSTGAIIATFLSWGLAVRDIEQLYLERSAEMFTKEAWHRRWKTKFRADPIARFFRKSFCEDEEKTVPALLGSKRLRTMLLMVMRNASTGSAWPVSNNPDAIYNDRSKPDCNLNIPLWQLLRGSTAAPSFFPPEEINLGGTSHLFVDGGITPFNNPALIAVLMATLPPYRLCWPATRDALHVVSVGTGTVLARLPHKLARQIHLLDQLGFVIPALLGSVAWEQDMICRVLGDCVHGAELDSEIGALQGPGLLGPDGQKFTYVRYDQVQKVVRADVKELPQKEGLLDDLSLIPALQDKGAQYAAENVQLRHLYPRSQWGQVGQ